MPWVHKLSNINKEDRTGVCSSCGFVRVKRNADTAYRCRIAANEDNKNYKIRKRLRDHPDKPNICSVCGSPGRICFDHNHKTGKFRGWLCSGCNLALGNVRDSPETLRKLADYLEK